MVTQGLFGAFWDANTVATTPETEVKYAALVEKARPLLAHAARPQEPKPPTWLVAPVSTGQRPTYVLLGGVLKREGTQYVPTTSMGRPTSCNCDAPLIFGAQKQCVVVGFLTADGGRRYTSCVAAK
jgi:hypothetical protein